MNRKDRVWNKLDWTTVVLFLVLLTCGWLSICGAGYSFDSSTLFDFSSRSGKQLVWIACSFVLAVVVLSFNQNVYRTYSYVFYALILFLLFITIFLAKDIKGSRSWLDLGPVSFQPAEFAKFATAIALARFIDEFGFDSHKIRDLLRTSLFFIVPLVLIICEKETGTALVFLAFFLVLYREGMNGLLLFSCFCAVLFFVIGIKYWNEPVASMPFNVGPFTVLTLIQLFTSIILWTFVADRRIGRVTLLIGLGSTVLGLMVSFLVLPFKVTALQLISIAAIVLYLVYQATKNLVKECIVAILFASLSTLYLFSCNFVFDHILQPHQQTRINIILGIEDDPYGAGYNVNQSKIAIGSGGLLGKGFLKGTQTKLKYVPEQDTDFIFCTIGEEQGFKGTAFILLLYATFILRLVRLSERQSSVFGRVFGYSVASIFLFHLFINVGMVIGITPVIGIPLPFFSYGGSSLWGFTLLLFVFLRIDSERTSRF
ncbi:MAG: rod shape-determining protein RodA [Bacteroidaceae bacterium]|nr:rod shape-determining protein RodA [Bacteroidaceae bacterium]